MARTSTTFTGNTTQEVGLQGGRGNQGYNTLAAVGTWGAGTLKVQAGFTDNTGAMNWIDIPGAELTADGMVSFAVACDSMRLVMTGAAAPSVQAMLR